MKKTIVTLLALAGVAMADYQPLTLTSPADAVLTTGNSQLDWSDEGVSNLTSWELSFDITVIENQQDQSYAKNGTIFYTNTANTQNSLTLDFWEGYLQLNTKNTTTEINSKSTNEEGLCLSAGETATVTITFVRNDDDSTGTGSLAVTSGAAKFSGSFEFKNKDINLTDIEKASNNTQLVTNGGAVEFSNISLKNITPSIPEPATATLSLLALAGLAARRRRK